MSDRPTKPNTRGNSLNRKAPVTISTWDEQKSTVRRLRRPYVIAGDAPRPVSLAEPNSSKSVRPNRPASLGSTRPSSLNHSDFDYGRSMVLNQSKQGFRSFDGGPQKEVGLLSVKDAVQTLSSDDYGK